MPDDTSGPPVTSKPGDVHVGAKDHEGGPRHPHDLRAPRVFET